MTVFLLLCDILFVSLTYFPLYALRLTQTEIHRLCNGAHREFIIAENADRYMTALCKLADDDYCPITIARDRVRVQLK